MTFSIGAADILGFVSALVAFKSMKNADSSSAKSEIIQSEMNNSLRQMRDTASLAVVDKVSEKYRERLIKLQITFEEISRKMSSVSCKSFEELGKCFCYLSNYTKANPIMANLSEEYCLVSPLIKEAIQIVSLSEKEANNETIKMDGNVLEKIRSYGNAFTLLDELSSSLYIGRYTENACSPPNLATMYQYALVIKLITDTSSVNQSKAIFNSSHAG